MPRYRRRDPLCQLGVWITVTCALLVAGVWLAPRLGL